jgi:hypothetical protein
MLVCIDDDCTVPAAIVDDIIASDDDSCVRALVVGVVVA